ncbi:hypothetical protein pdam_00025349 [Pocillopora damicornis]|uniref:Uncharacterized protein n=1 Tax=Pocillopora damicornis TaxID=46731 RepID=A0A3M6TYY8_POCDA|nr:hypothetical protein pdam_00025349 [Pocillopora damicornis]
MCAASQKKSLVGLDSTQTDGVNAVASLEEIIDFLKEIAENDDDMSDPGSSLQLPNLSQTEEESEKLSCQEEGCIKVFQSFAALQKHLNRGGNW